MSASLAAGSVLPKIHALSAAIQSTAASLSQRTFRSTTAQQATSLAALWAAVGQQDFQLVDAQLLGWLQWHVARYLDPFIEQDSQRITHVKRAYAMSGSSRCLRQTLANRYRIEFKRSLLIAPHTLVLLYVAHLIRR